MDRPLSRSPLPRELYGEQRRCAEESGLLDTEEKVFDFLGKRIAHIQGLSEHLMGLTSGRDCEEFHHNVLKLAALTKFYFTLLSRYLEKTRGMPSENEYLADFGTSEGNQVDEFLARYFRVK